MRVLSYILTFAAGAILVLLLGKSEEAKQIKEDHAAMIVTVTVEKKSVIDSLLDANLVLDQENEVIKKNIASIGNDLKKSIKRENQLTNTLLSLDEKLRTYNYFDFYTSADSAAIWLIERARFGHPSALRFD